MITSRKRIAATLFAVVVLSAMSVPAAPAAEKNPAGLVVEGWEVAGSEVIVKVTNLGDGKGSAVVQVKALAGGFPMRNAATVAVPAGGSQWVSVGFGLDVTGVMDVWIIESSDPTN